MADLRCDSADLLGGLTLTPYTPTAHYDNVRDAATKGPVQFATQIAALHTFGESRQHDTLLKNLTRIAEPAVRCRMKVDGGEWQPSTREGAKDGYQLFVTYNHLMYAPQLRLECRFVPPLEPDAPPYHVVVLEFPLSSANDKSAENYTKTAAGDHPRITFSARGAASAGLGKMRTSNFFLQRPERQILDCFEALQTQNGAPIELELDLSMLSDAQRLDLAEIENFLPGGSGTPLPSLIKPEYFALCDGDSFTPSTEHLKTPNSLMKSDVPFPMAPLAALETFASTKQAAIHLAYSAHHAALEEGESLRAWATTTHRAAVFELENCAVPVLAVKFDRSFTKLGGLREDMKFKLPHDLKARATFLGEESAWPSRDLALVLDEITGIPRCDATFLVLNGGGFARLLDADQMIYDATAPYPEFREIRFKPDLGSPTLKAFMNTAEKLQAQTPWTPHLLNQDTSQLEYIDLTSDIELARVQEAEEWLYALKPWNAEQRQLLQCIHRAKGRMVIAKGPAGTGKSSLQCGIAMYFAKLGFKVLIAPPSNSNASHTAFEVNMVCPQEDEVLIEAMTHSHSSPTDGAQNDDGDSRISGNPDPEIPACDTSPDHSSDDHYYQFRGISTPRTKVPTARRLFANSLTQTLQEILQKEARDRPGSSGESSMAESSLMFVLQALKDRKAGGRDFSVDQAVIDEAEKKRFKMFGKSEEGDIKPENDVWDIFRKHLQAARENKFSWSDDALKHEFATAYDLCRKHVIAATQVLVTTSGNSGSSEIAQDWVRSQEEFGIPNKGVIVFLDEAMKDSELGTWNAIMAAGKRTKACFLFGDEFQLKPTNITSKDKLVFGQFNDQLDLSLPSRLVAHGYPYVYLKEQQRMHPCISKFPNEEFYSGQLRDGLRVQRTLDDDMPGLNDVLHGIIKDSYGTLGNGNSISAQHYWNTRTDEKARHHYLEVDGQRRAGDDGTSKYVQEHVDVFFKHVFPALQSYFGDATSKNVMIICAYTAAKVRYRGVIERLQNEQRRSANFFPSIEDVASDSDSASSGSSNSGTATPVTTSSRPRNLEAEYSRYLTIDAAQGQESFFVWMDGSFQHRDDLGFMTDRGRCNVAMTRAKGCFWMVGGSLDCKLRRRWNYYLPLSPFPKLKQQMAREGKVHRIAL